MTIKNTKGSLLIEVMVSMSLMVIFSVAIGSLALANSHLVIVAQYKSDASALAKESMEQLYALKLSNWSAISSVAPGYYQITESGNVYVLVADTATPPGELINSTYTRTVKISKAYRDVSGAIAASGTEDTNVRRFDVVVSWHDSGALRQVRLESYVTNWKGN